MIDERLRALAPGPAVTQRLKRMQTIVDKLTRESGLDLSRMQDIGGCRVVTTSSSIPELRRIEEHIHHRWEQDVRWEKDYISEPRESGYRAVHIVIEKDGHLIEIQLRTSRMHQWAETVEAFSDVMRRNYKQDGNEDVQEFMKLRAQVDILADAGRRPGLPLRADINGLAGKVQEHLQQVERRPNE